ncbi:SDR family NAD(P)-dependent oxidoreductase [Mesorhizobium sp. M0590]
MIVALEGKNLVVTGGTQGLGETIARLASADGGEGIAIVGRNAERGRRIAEELHDQAGPSSSSRPTLEIRPRLQLSWRKRSKDSAASIVW